MAGLPQEGQSFGRYDIVRRIGRGGMGVVYAAVQQGLGREVALKVLSSELAEDEDYRARFLREAEIMARLDSPHVIQVFDAGEHDGWLYIATQLVPDGDLHELLGSRGPLPDHLALDLVGQVADGIAAAHRAGIIHRDIKPSNVLLRRMPDEGLRAYVCDLGISRSLDSEHTRTQGIIGTFTYMAPERHEGHEATASSDIYALGCLLWAALSGRAPYEGTDGQVLMGHLSGPIPQLQRQDPVAQRINEILRRSMAKDLAGRHATAEEFAAECRSAGGPVADDEQPTRVPGGPLPTQQFTGPQHSGPQHSGPQWAPQPAPYSSPGGPGTSPQQGRSRTPWIVGGVAAAVLLIGGGIGLTVALTGDDGDGDTGSSSLADVPDDADLEEYCAHYDASPERDLDSMREYVATMKEIGTPADMPESAREGYLWQIEVTEEATDYDELIDTVQNMPSERRTQVNSLDTWSQSNCL